MIIMNKIKSIFSFKCILLFWYPIISIFLEGLLVYKFSLNSILDPHYVYLYLFGLSACIIAGYLCLVGCYIKHS